MPGDSREAMINSAIMQFRQHGVAGASMRSIVEAGGAPRGSLYHHFPGGKDELAAEATRRAGDVIGALLATLADADPALLVDGFASYWTRAMERADFVDGCPVAAAALSGDDTSSARTAAGTAFAAWEGLLSDGLTGRGIESERAGRLATMIIASVEGALLLARARRSVEPLHAVAAELKRLLADVKT